MLKTAHVVYLWTRSSKIKFRVALVSPWGGVLRWHVSSSERAD